MAAAVRAHEVRTNALLSRTGQPTRKFMLVLATNRPQDLDSAVLDRIDDSITPTAREKERVFLLELYLQSTLGRPPRVGPQRQCRGPGRWLGFRRKPKVIKLVGFPGGEAFKKLAKLTDGFSGREVSKLISSVWDPCRQSLAEDGDSSSLSWKEAVEVVETKGEGALREEKLLRVETLRKSLC